MGQYFSLPVILNFTRTPGYVALNLCTQTEGKLFGTDNFQHPINI